MYNTHQMVKEENTQQKEKNNSTENTIKQKQ